MASSSDGRRKKKKIQHNCMEQPPLIKMLKNILSEYPDGGQILKELIQNAEDAGARTVKLLYDGRRFNDSSGEDTPEYTKFFKAPALCVYNDAVFSKDDWKGIQMIYSSVKENEKLKVGKFGLGFKSVFHITDYPCVLSGDTILLVNPHLPSHMVNSVIDLSEVNDYEHEGLIAEDLWKALDETFGFKKCLVDSGNFPGTLFWFPLREVKSELSETLYHESKVNDLFESFQTEADNLLIFMKSLEQISLHRRSDRGIEDVMNVEIENAKETVRPKRDRFNETVRIQTESNADGDDIHCYLPMTIRMQSLNRNEAEHWYVVNYVVNNSASGKFKEMIRDSSTGKCPYVGVAVPVRKQIQGNVYCFLPLPQEGETLTGLPVHVNGFFELNQNRHNLKWDTDEHAGRPTDDRCILWNKALIAEALPKAYAQLVMGTIENMPRQPQQNDLDCVYNMLPLRRSSSNAQRRWSSLSNGLYKKLESRRVVYSQTSENWIPIKDACFATFRDISVSDGGTRDSIVRCLKSTNKMYAKISDELFETLCEHFRYIENLSASKLASFLRNGSGYQTLSNDDKKNILSYLLTIPSSTTALEGLQLLPLDDGTWCEFRQRGNKVYFCADDEEVQLFPGLGYKIVLKQSHLGTSLHDKLACCRGMYQIEKLSNDMVKGLLAEVLAQYYGINAKPMISSTSSLNMVWLENVWTVLQRKGNIKSFLTVPLVPVLKQGTWTSNPVVELHKSDGMFFLTDCNNSTLSAELRECFEALMVTIIPSKPTWISSNILKKIAFEATNEGMVSLLRAISCHNSSSTGISQFNNLSEHAINSLKTFLMSNSIIDASTINLMKQLRMFQAIQSTTETGGRRSVYECPSYIITTDLDMLPKTKLPQRVIRANTNEENLLRCLGAQSIPMSQLVREMLSSFNSKPFTTPTENGAQNMIEFMDFFVNKFDLFAQDGQIINLAKNVRFLASGSRLHQPSQLFDPHDKTLQALLHHQDLFPIREQGFSDQYMFVLRLLGLKVAGNLDENVILQVAIDCHRLSQIPTEKDALRAKSSQLMNFLCDKPDFLSRTCTNGRRLLQSLNDLNCVPVATKPPDYPSVIPWISDGIVVCKPSAAASKSWALMVGAQKHIVGCDSDKVCELFEWNNVPSLENVVSQLEILEKHFELHLKPEFLHVIQKIYTFLNSQQTHQLQSLKTLVTDRKIIWTGFGFEIPKKVIVNHRSDDIDLKPFYHTSPEEFSHLANLFLSLGCQSVQDNRLLSQLLHEIKKGYDTQVCSTSTIEADRKLILKVLQKLSENLKDNADEIRQMELLMMVENDSDCIDMKPISCCILDENDDDNLEEDSDLKFVHDRVPRQVAMDLGIKSAKSKTLTESINAFQPWGQTEPLTKRIETLLKREYTFGLGVPKELIQNADDAGASVVKFMFDERENDDARDRLLSPAMSECQGSALWVYNDETFSNDDLENIRLLNGGTKAENAEKIGKFGLGFCAVYNLTELPCFISGENLVIFDPQEKYLRNLCETNSPGLKVNLTNRKRRRLIKDHIDQFKPFNNVFGCIPTDSGFDGFLGTLFRFPLRTSDQAMSSKLCQKPCLRDDIVQLLQTVMENAGNLLLFTQHVSRLEIYHIPKGETNPSNATMIFEINKSTENATGATNVQGVLTRLHSLMRPSLSEIHRLRTEQRYFGDHNFSNSTLNFDCRSSWVVSWVSQPMTTVQLQVERSKKHIPISAIALPLLDTAGKISPMQLQELSHGFYSYGYLFCFLPLPIQTKMPFHINGCFEVSSDRKRLVHSTGDEIGGNSEQKWNQQILEGPVVASFIQLLEYLASKCDDNYKYYSMWPTTVCNIVNDFRAKFISTVYTTSAKLFRSSRGWHSFGEVVFLHPDIRSQSVIYDAAFDMLGAIPIHTGKQIIDMPEDVFLAFKECIKGDQSLFNGAIISEIGLIHHFLDIINEKYWNDKINTRNSLILFALAMNDDTILNKMKNTACIPSLPAGLLRKPCDLINPVSEIAKMFNVNDGYFPEGGVFAEKDILTTLARLGMICEVLPKPLFIDRCHSVSTFGNTCSKCSRDQCANVLKYIAKHVLKSDMDQDTDLIESLKHIPILPVLERPQNWPFSWAADKINASCVLCTKHSGITPTPFKVQQSVTLYQEDVGKCIGSIRMVIDECFLKSSCSIYFSTKIYELLGVLTIPTTELLKDQLCCFATEYNNRDIQFGCLNVYYHQIYSKLQEYIQQSVDQETMEANIRDLFSTLQDEPIVLIDQELVAPRRVAFNIKNEFSPYLCRLSTSQQSRKKLYCLIGVCEHFTPEKIVDGLQIIKSSWTEKKCVDTVADMLKNLCESMEKENKVYNDLEDLKELIVAPDVTEVLLPTHLLVVDDRQFMSKKKMHFLHGQIPPDVAEMVGVKSKRKHVVDGFSKLMPFGQKENLSTRLRGLLEDYPCDASIMKELLQNADDAKATELHFIKDFRNITPSDSMSFGSNAMQPPALCVFNDGYFTDADFEGIQSLGEGSKRGDPSKTGQYGVGFNTVYHITDSPSFYTKGPGLGPRGTLCIFDPLMQVIPDYVSEDERGIKCDVEEMDDNFPDILGYYLSEAKHSIFAGEEGTLFRLPLRQQKSDISNEIMTMDKINTYLEEMKADMFEMLLFVKHVKKIKISRVNENNKIIEEYCVDSTLSVEDMEKRKSFFANIRANIVLSQQIVDYQMKIVDNNWKEANWCVIQCYGFCNADDNVNSTLKCIRDDGICQLPLGGVAMPVIDKKLRRSIMETKLSNDEKEKKEQLQELGKVFEKELGDWKLFQGKAFCFLPIRGNTTLKFHYNGHFVLDRARTGINMDGVKGKWNALLLKEVVVKAWVHGMMILKDELGHCVQISHNWEVVNQIMSIYHILFPKRKTAYDSLNAHIAGCIYQTITKERTALMPIVMHKKDCLKLLHCSNSSKDTFVLKWTGLANDNYRFGGIFNNIINDIKSHTYFEPFELPRGKKARKIGNALKMIGMKLIELPGSIYKDIISYEVQVLSARPNTVANFLASYDSNDENSCNIGTIDVKIDQTVLKTTDNVSDLVSYLTQETSTSSMKPNDKVSSVELLKGLPLCVTGDNVLHVFDPKTPVYWSKYSHLLPMSLSSFLGTSLLNALATREAELLSAGLIKEFAVTDLQQMLHLSYNRELLTSSANVRWVKEENKPFSTKFLKDIYSFIVANSQKRTSGLSYFDNETFMENIRKLQEWAFIPSVQTTGNNQLFELVPISKGEKVLHIDSYIAKEQYVAVLNKMNIPMLDKTVFESDVNSYETSEYKLFKSLESVVATFRKPCSFLRFLHYYKDRLAGSDISIEDGSLLLSFFEQHTGELANAQLINVLREMPLFQTVQGGLDALTSFSKAIVLPHNIPKNGLLDWSTAINTLLLHEDSGAKTIYKKLNLKLINNIQFYVEHLLPNINELPHEHFIVHIECIRDMVMPLVETDSNEYSTIVDTLKGVPFIEVLGQRMKASELFLEENPVFYAMCDKHQFLPRTFLTPKWQNFLKPLGLNVDVSNDLLIQFASEIEANGMHKVSKKTASQSKVLLKFFVELRNLSDRTLHQLKDIKFIFPGQARNVEKDLLDICPQIDNGERLVCFNGNIPHFMANICWTSLHLLPYPKYKGQLAPNICERLGILKSPPMSAVILHCQNFCDKVNSSIQNQGTINMSLITQIFVQMYEFMVRHLEQLGAGEKQRLHNTHVVLVPNDAMLVKAEDVVVELRKDDEIKPYLWQIPDEFSRFRDVFLSLGSERDVKCSHYVAVLNKIKNNFHDFVPPKEMEDVVKCLKGLVKLTQTEEEINLPNAGIILYLPNRRNQLVNSMHLTISDNHSFETRLGDNCNLNFFAGFKDLGINVSDPSGPFAKLPSRLRPRVLSNLIQEDVCLDSLRDMHCRVAFRLENFLRSPYLMQGIVRLVKHQFKEGNLDFLPGEESKITTALSHICVQRVTGLQTNIKFEGSIVPSSSRDKRCFIQQSNENGDQVFRLYFQVDEISAEDAMTKLTDEEDGLLELIDKCTDGRMNKHTYKYVSSILREMLDPSRIEGILDDKHITAYHLPIELSASFFPPPGTYVPEHFFPFLERSILLFRDHEFRYIAYDVGEFNDTMDEYTEVYIYAHIIRPVDPGSPATVGTQYEIDIGEELSLTVPLHRLFKFVPQTTETGTDLVVYDDEPIGTVAFDENCRRIRVMLIEAWSLSEGDKRRIIHRLKLKWHPDKHTTNKEYATKVYHYLNYVILELEKNGTVGDLLHDSPSDMSDSAYGNMSANAHTAGNHYAQAWHNNLDTYRHGGQYSHSGARSSVCRDVGNAKRWQRQATNDFRMAQDALAVARQVHGYNWICYKCHQACEKSLKAAGFATDANNVIHKSHSLYGLASALSNTHLTGLVQNLETSLGPYFGLRYPDACSRQHIPSDVITKAQAKSALQVTREVLDIVSGMIE